MSDIGGNTTAILQVQSENGVDEIGNPVISWEEAGSYPGWLVEHFRIIQEFLD